MRTHPESGPGAGDGGDPGMVNRLAEAAQKEFGAPAPQTEGVKKNYSADGTTPNGNTASNEFEPPAAREAARTGLRTSTPSGNGTRQTPTEKEGAESVERVPSGGGSGVGDGEAEEAPEALDPLALLNKGLPKEEEEFTQENEQAETETPKETSAPKEKPESGGKALRTQLEKTLAESKQLKQREKELEQRLKALEGPDNPKIKELTSAWELQKKRADELEQKVAHYDYTESTEFKERYVKPFEDKFREAQDRLSKIQKADGTKLTLDELESIMVNGEVEAYEAISNIFDGAKATYAANLVKDVYSLDRARTLALQQSKQTALQRRKEGQAQLTARQEAIRNHFTQEIETRREASKEWYAPRENDTKWNKALQEGEVLANAAFIPPQNIKPEQAVAIMAETRLRAAAFPALQQETLSLRGKVKALEKELARFKGSAPGKGEVGDPAAKPKTYEIGDIRSAKEALAAFIEQ